jgi:hypothetical protein
MKIPEQCRVFLRGDRLVRALERIRQDLAVLEQPHDASFDLATDIGRAVGVGGLRSGHSNGNMQHQKISISEICLGSDSELKSQMAIKWQ